MNASMRTLIALTATTLVACGGTTTQSEPQAPEIAGVWESPCMAQSQADGSTLYAKLVFDITAEVWTLDYSTFGDDACATPLMTVDITGPYTIGAQSEVVDGAWDGEFAFSSKTVTAHNEGMVGFLSSLDGCGEGDWTVGEAKDVYGTGCAALGQYPQTDCSADYDLVALVDGQLRFGARPADNNMCSPDKRPTALSPMVLSLRP